MIEQNDNEATMAPKISKDDLRINWNQDSSVILAMIKAFSPTPGAFTTINNKRLKIFKADVIDYNSNNEVGVIYNVCKNYFDVQCEHSSLRLHCVQLEGKRVMDSKDFILGYQNLDSSSLV